MTPIKYRSAKISAKHRAIHIVARGGQVALCGAHVGQGAPPQLGDKFCSSCEAAARERRQDEKAPTQGFRAQTGG